MTQQKVSAHLVCPGAEDRKTLAVAKVLERLARLDPRRAELVNLRYAWACRPHKPPRPWASPNRTPSATGPSRGRGSSWKFAGRGAAFCPRKGRETRPADSRDHPLILFRI